MLLHKRDEGQAGTLLSRGGKRGRGPKRGTQAVRQERSAAREDGTRNSWLSHSRDEKAVRGNPSNARQYNVALKKPLKTTFFFLPQQRRWGACQGKKETKIRHSLRPPLQFLAAGPPGAFPAAGSYRQEAPTSRFRRSQRVTHPSSRAQPRRWAGDVITG